MGNRLLQEARRFTEKATESSVVSTEDIEKAKNAISSAFANSTTAQQELLQQYQKELDALELE